MFSLIGFILSAEAFPLTRTSASFPLYKFLASTTRFGAMGELMPFRTTAAASMGEDLNWLDLALPRLSLTYQLEPRPAAMEWFFQKSRCTVGPGHLQPFGAP